MERVDVLIDRLLAQHRNNAGKEKLIITAQLLLSELQKVDEENYEDHSSVVSVFYPAFHKSHTLIEETDTEVAVKPKEAKPDVENIKPVVENIKPAEVNTAAPVVEEEPKNGDTFFDPMTEIPTLALKQQEINDSIAANGESLNDKLKMFSARKEIAHSLKGSPIKDLRKAIGINDRYVFINELFRGDETMYDRSIKTINSFNIYGEAELWIKRELKLKLAWNENSEPVQIFDELVKRRFS